MTYVYKNGLGYKKVWVNLHKNSFTRLTPRACIITFLQPQLIPDHSKLECLSSSVISTLLHYLYAGLTLVEFLTGLHSNAGSYPSCKYWNKAKVTDGDQHPSLLGFTKNYSSKRFYDTVSLSHSFKEIIGNVIL
jgi:hypothetical protein